MPRVLVLESSQRGLDDLLRSAGHKVVSLSCEEDSHELGDSIRQSFEGRPADIVVADLSNASDLLPVRHLQWILREIWGGETRLPCLALVTPNHLALPELPAFIEDFLLPPYDRVEITVRIALLLFRIRKARDTEQLTFADLTLDLTGGKAFDVNGGEMVLTRREFELLRFLCTHRGKFFDRDRLLSLVWGIEFAGGDRTVDIHICRLRSKLPPHASSLLETRRGLGYGFQVAS
jgi:DNA-binding response OmpR family regulator